MDAEWAAGRLPALRRLEYRLCIHGPRELLFGGGDAVFAGVGGFLSLSQFQQCVANICAGQPADHNRHLVCVIAADGFGVAVQNGNSVLEKLP